MHSPLHTRLKAVVAERALLRGFLSGVGVDRAEPTRASAQATAVARVPLDEDCADDRAGEILRGNAR